MNLADNLARQRNDGDTDIPLAQDVPLDLNEVTRLH